MHLEEGIPQSTVDGLRAKGHNVEVVTGYDRGMFGRSQIIIAGEDEGVRVWSAGSDFRGDGHAVGYFFSFARNTTQTVAGLANPNLNQPPPV